MPQVALSQLYIALDEGETGGIVRCMAALGMDFSALGGGAAEPALVAKMAAIMFDTRYGTMLSSHYRDIRVPLKGLSGEVSIPGAGA